jgi:hypothetical protein
MSLDSDYGIDVDCGNLRTVLKELRKLRADQMAIQQRAAENSLLLRAAVARYNAIIQALQSDVIETLGPQVSTDAPAVAEAVENPPRAVRVREETPTESG